MKIDDSENFTELLSKSEEDTWRELFRCERCGQNGLVEKPDQHQTRSALKLPNSVIWKSFDTDPLKKRPLLDARGGTKRPPMHLNELRQELCP
jgi:hypothetical protein